MAKTPPGDFKVPTPEIPLLSQQAVTSKGITVPYTNLQLNPYPNTQLDLFCSDNFSFWCTAPNTWLTNCADPNTRLQSPTRESCWLQSSSVIPTMKIKKILSHITLRCTNTTTFSQEQWTRAKLCLRSQFAWTNFTQHLSNLWALWRPLKESLYMYRVVRKESSNTYSRIGWKS